MGFESYGESILPMDGFLKMTRVLAVDPGEKRLGLAISDLSGTIANPLTVINHISRPTDAQKIIEVVQETQAELIIIGQALDVDGQPGPQARKSERLAETIQSITDVPVVLWDESHSTDMAQEARRKMGVNRKKRKGHLDDIAATVILQSYLDAQRND